MPSPTRRQVLAIAGSASLALAGCTSPFRPSEFDAVEGAWPMVGRDSGHARRVPGGPTDPRTVWTTDLDQVRAAGTPSVVGDRLYVPVDAVSDRARHRYRVHALDATTGEERWQVPLRSEPNAPLAVSGDHVVVTARRALERGRVVCFRPRYGKENWLFDVDARLTAPPTVAGGTVYVPDWRGRVHALSVRDGSVRWSRRVDADGSGRTFAGPVAVHDGTLYLGSSSGTTGVMALDAETGDERWSVSTGAVTAGPVVHDGLVIVRSHGLVVAVGTDGTRRWSFNVLDSSSRPMAVDDEHVYVPARDALYAIDRSGQEAWTYEPSDGGVGTPTVAGDSVLVRGNDRLTALAGSDGDERWRRSPDGTGRAVVAPRAVFLSGDGGTVIGLGNP